MLRRVLFVSVLAAAGALAACSDDTAAPDALGEPVAVEVVTTSLGVESCDLLSVADIERITGTVLPEGEVPDEQDSPPWSICNWEDLDAGAAIQVQVHLGDGRADFERRRHELGSGSVGPTRDIELDGADAAYDDADQGVVGALVGEHFIQVTTIGGAFDDEHHLALAEAAIQGLDR